MLTAGMMVHLRNGTDAIIAIRDSTYPYNSLMVCWNKGSSLILSNYNSDLTYKGNDEYNIDIVYDVGSFVLPFDTDVNNRIKLWERDKLYFPGKDKIFLHEIQDILNKSFHRSVKSYITHIGKYLFVRTDRFCEDNNSFLMLPEQALYGYTPENQTFEINDIIESKDCTDVSLL